MVDRSRIPTDHPLKRILPKVDAQRTKKELPNIFNFESSPLERDDVDVQTGPRGVHVEPDGYLDDNEFSAFTDAAKESDALRYDSMDQSNFVVQSELETADPWAVHSERERETAIADTNRKATVTTDPELYATDPERYDYPFVDTPQEFRDEFESASFSRFEREAGADDIFRY